MSIKGLQVIAQYPEQNATGEHQIRCRGFYNIRNNNPALVAFMGIDPSAMAIANRLGAEFCARVKAMSRVVEVSEVPCGSLIPSHLHCHASREPNSQKLLVLVGPGVANTVEPKVSDLPKDAQEWIRRSANDATWDVLPVLPGGSRVNQILSVELRHKNVAFWHVDPESEVVPGVMQRAGLAPEEYRIFISYIRRETTELAEQLHDALTHAGFAVFLDRFSVPVGVDFQERLMDELAGRGMVLLLHSPGLGSSPWVEAEIATVTKYRLGLYVLRLPGVPERSNISPDRSREITDLEWDVGTRRLSESALAGIVQEIKRVHHDAHQRQLRRMVDAVVAAFTDHPAHLHGCRLHFEAGGNLVVTRPTGVGSADEVVIHFTARPPELCDFYHVHAVGRAATRARGAIIAPAPYVAARRRTWFDWLGGLSNVRHVDEGQMNNAISQIIAGGF